MTVTISEGINNSHVRIHSKDARFKKEWGEEIMCNANGMYKNLAMISTWVNNNYREECLFEVD